MGQSYTYRCGHCGYEERFNQGHGFLVRSQPLNEYLKQRTKLFHYKTDHLLNQLAKQYSGLFLKAGFQVYKCPKCKVLHDKTEVVVFDENETVIHKVNPLQHLPQPFKTDQYSPAEKSNLSELREKILPNRPLEKPVVGL